MEKPSSFRPSLATDNVCLCVGVQVCVSLTDHTIPVKYGLRDNSDGSFGVFFAVF